MALVSSRLAPALVKDSLLTHCDDTSLAFSVSPHFHCWRRFPGFGTLACRSRWKRNGCFDGGTCQGIVSTGLIVARAGGSRPPPGSSRRPRPMSRQKLQEAAPSDRPPVNDEILASVVRLVSEDGKLVGILPTDEALQRAREAELDLVQLDKQDPPCVKIIEYSKYRYELQKKKREQQKKNAANRMDLKELKMRYNIDTHDYDVRLRSAERFLKEGDKVKLIIQFKGREMEFKDLGVGLFKRFQDDLGELAMVESKLAVEGRNMSMILAPNKTKLQGQVQNTDKSKQKLQGVDTVEAAAAVVEV